MKKMDPIAVAKAAKKAKSNKGAATAFAIIFAVLAAVIGGLTFVGETIVDMFEGDMIAEVLGGIVDILVDNQLVAYIVIAVLFVLMIICAVASGNNGKEIKKAGKDMEAIELYMAGEEAAAAARALKAKKGDALLSVIDFFEA